MKVSTIAKLTALSAFLTGAAFGQTVAPENWMGQPISTVGGEMAREEVIAAMGRSSALPQASQEHWLGTVASAAIGAGKLKRSEVVADYNLYARAGLSNYVSRAYFEPFSAESQRRNSMYQRLRAGPEYALEVARVERDDLPAVANASASDASAD